MKEEKTRREKIKEIPELIKEINPWKGRRSPLAGFENIIEQEEDLL